MAITKPRRPRFADAEHELISVDEASDRYPLEWILLKVTRFSEAHEMSHGYVLAHTKSRKQISKVIARSDREDPGALLYTFLGGTKVLSQEEWRRRLDELADQPYINAHW